MPTFEEFTSSLTSSHLKLSQPENDYFVVPTEAVQPFVAPELREIGALSVGDGNQVTLVSAPAAVGKSTFALQLAHRLSSPLWDLAKAPSVGSGALDGQLSHSFGRRSAADFLEEVEKGCASILIDATDEARIRITEATFADFLASLFAIAGKSKNNSLIILGRTQVIEDVWLYASESKISIRAYQIDYFDDIKALEFLDAYVRRFRSKDISNFEQYFLPYTSARDAIVSAVKQAVSGSTSTGFLGYAPVLLAIARALSGETNFQSVISKWANGGTVLGKPIQILLQLINDILQRECGKLKSNLEPALTQTVSKADLGRLYSPEEQCARIFSRSFGLPFTPTVGLSAKEALAYEESVARFLPDHPFFADGTTQFANAVFRDYVFSKLLLGQQDSDHDHITSNYKSQEGRPSRLFFDFYLSQADDDWIVPMNHIAILFDALISSETIESTTLFSLTTNEIYNYRLGKHQPRNTAYIETVEGNENVDPIELEVEYDKLRSFEFIGQLRNIDISIDSPIRLIPRNGEFEFVGDISLESPEITCDAANIIVRPSQAERDGGSRNANVTIRTDKFSGQIDKLPKVYGSLSVNWPGAQRFPWSSFYEAEKIEEGRDNNFYTAARILRKIMTSFRSHSKGSLARYKDKIDSERMTRGKLGKAVLNKLIADKFIELRGKFYHLNSDAVSEKFEISYHDMRDWALGAKAREYLDLLVAEFNRERE